MNLSSFLLCLFFSELLVSSGSLSSSALISKYEDESNGPDFADLKRRLENELIVEESHRHLEGDVSPVGIETEADIKNKKKDKKGKRSKGSGPQVPSTSAQPPSEALLFLTDETIDQVVDDWSGESYLRNSKAKYRPVDEVSRVTNILDYDDDYDDDDGGGDDNYDDYDDDGGDDDDDGGGDDDY